MSAIKKEDEGKWINAFAATSGIILGYLSIALLSQLGEWFDLEARIPHFLYVNQGVGIAVGLGSFITILKHQKIPQTLAGSLSRVTKSRLARQGHRPQDNFWDHHWSGHCERHLCQC